VTGPSRRRATRVTAGLVAAAVLVWLPHHASSVTTNKLNVAIYLSVAVLSLNLLTGVSGQISIGHSAFFGLGAYTTAILVQDHGWPYLATLPAAAGLSFVVGVIAGFPALRIRGFYLALASLGLGMLFPQVVQRFTDFTGGTGGRSVDDRFPAPGWSGLTDAQWRYYVLLAIAAVVFLLVRNIVHGRVGRALNAVRDNEIAAQTSGVDVAWYRVVTFGTSAAIAGIAGTMFTMHNHFVASTDFGLQRSIDFLVGMVVGGGSVISGAIVGGLFLQYVPEYVQDFGLNPLLTPVLYGALLLFCVYVFHDGVAGTLIALQRRFVERLSGRSAARADAVPAEREERARPARPVQPAVVGDEAGD
jgi:branched-chain amino acid transport system permease protein